MTENLSLDNDGRWRPAIPEPFWVSAGWFHLFRLVPRCDCGLKFTKGSDTRRRHEYRKHYRATHQ